MKVRNKIGFHTAVGGNPTGIGDYVRRLDEAGIPVCIVAADGTTGIGDVIARWEQGSTVPHIICWRRVIGPQNFDRSSPEFYSVPKYHDPPASAAKDHWDLIKPTIPPEISRHKDKIWLLPINEIDKEQCDWLGTFSVEFCKLANADGYKISMFAWSSGEPEREGWEQPGMLDYLRYCEQNPDMAAVALHEYSYVVDDVKDAYPHKIGRFQLLFDVCDVHGIARPKLHITEWGWTLDSVPGPKDAIKDIEEIGELYSAFPEIEGAAIWYLGPEFKDIANRAQKLIAPVADFSINHIFDAPDTPPPLDDVFRTEISETDKEDKDSKLGKEGQQGRGEPAFSGEPAPTKPRPVTAPTTEPALPTPQAQPNALFIADVTIPDDTRITVGKSFTKTWRLKNSGNAAWTSGYKLIHIGGDAMGAATSQAVPQTATGATADLSITFTAPSLAGTFTSNWRLQDDQGNFFGDFVFTRIITELATVQPTGVAKSAFVADVTIPDDTEIEAETAFTKTWRLKNNGTLAWGAGFHLHFLGGDTLTNNPSGPSLSVPVSASGDFSVPMVAPATPGTYTSHWRMKDDHDNFFGEEVYVRIVVIPAREPKVHVPLQTGMNINPDAPNSDPADSNDLDGTNWVRYVFKLAAREDVSERGDINKAFAQYDTLIRKYDAKDIKSMIVINQETIWGTAPWTGNNNWQAYANELATTARQIASRYSRYGEKIAYEIWNEGDLPNNPASVYIPPADFAIVLKTVADAIRAVAPDSPLIFGGLATGPEVSIKYLQECLAALGGEWPVDAIGIHPYGRWATRPPFDWGQQFGTLGDAFARYEQAIPGIPFWITEIGVAADNEIGPQYYAEIADYVKDVHEHIAAEYTYLVPVIVWFAWSDWMRNSGIVQRDGSHKNHVYDAYQAVLKVV